MIKGMVNVFFDFDMTLGFRILMWRDTVRELLLEQGVVVSVDEIRNFYEGKGYPWSRPMLTHQEFFNGKGWWDNTRDFIYDSLLDLCDIKRARAVADNFRERYIDIRYWKVFPDTVPTLKALKSQGYNLYILSNHVPEAHDIINSLGIGEYFVKMFISADIGAEKPNPMIYHRALEGLDGINIMVGDNYEADISGALQNGFDGAVLVRKPNTNNLRRYSKYLDGVILIIQEVINET
ncbi:MAG: HAD family hydrolase [Christensenellales bacterium]|jgi:putative hydrolase of the HAD superfamily